MTDTDEAKRPRKPRAPQPRVQVTQEHITGSMQRDSSHCMIADAVRDAVPGAQRIAVDLQTIRFTDPKTNYRYTYLTPRTAQVALVKFDQGDEGIEPFAFSLRQGQVTLANVTTAGRPRPKAGQSTEAVRQSAREAAKIARGETQASAIREGLGKAELKNPRGNGEIPVKVGGSPPPVTRGRRRAFGIRALER